MATASPLLPGHLFGVTVATADHLEVRKFRVREALSELFEVELYVVSEDPEVDLAGMSGQPARFTFADETRSWSGICAEAELVRVEPQGMSTYRLRIVPPLWLLGHRRNYRVFQQMSELEIALDVLGRWGIVPRLELSPAQYRPRRYRVQYGETDLQFVRRMLEDIGVTFYFAEDAETTLVLADAPNRTAPGIAVPFYDQPNDHTSTRYVTDLRLAHRVRPGKFVQADVDWRRPPDAPIRAEARGGANLEHQLELFHLDYGSFLFRAENTDGATPNADDRGAQRTDDEEGARVARRRLDATRNDARVVTFRTTEYRLRPGVVMQITHHPRSETAEPLLVATSVLEGEIDAELRHTVEARAASADFRPALVTARPRATGVESATVVGPPGEEIHTDEFGRIRVQFHWDREGARDDKSSCWVPVSQNWGGASFGGVMLPRVGSEVLVDFLGGDPDRPVVMGRVFTTTQPVPYQLPQFKSLSGFRTETYPRPKPGLPVGSLLRALGLPLGEGAVDPLATPPLPGPFAGVQAAADTFAEALQGTQSKGADASAHARSCNEIMCRDDAGAEQLHIQAQRDLAMNVKNNASGTVGANRAFTVLGNDSETVSCHQSTNVGANRTVTVSGAQTHVVTGVIKQETLEASQYLFAKEDIVTACKTNRVNGSEMNLLRCGESTIVMRPGFILIQSPFLFLNPGQAAVDAAIESNVRPQTAEEAAQAKAAAEAAAAAEASAAAAADASASDAAQAAHEQQMSRENMGPGMRDAYGDPKFEENYDRAVRDAAEKAYADAGRVPPPGSIDGMLNDLKESNEGFWNGWRNATRAP